jgi:hypothetical protein
VPFCGLTDELHRLVGKYCGNQTVSPPILKSRTNSLVLQFITDRSISAGGFQVQLTADMPPSHRYNLLYRPSEKPVDLRGNVSAL